MTARQQRAATDSEKAVARDGRPPQASPRPHQRPARHHPRTDHRPEEGHRRATRPRHPITTFKAIFDIPIYAECTHARPAHGREKQRPAPPRPRPPALRPRQRPGQDKRKKAPIAGGGEVRPPAAGPHCRSLPEPVKRNHLDRTRTATAGSSSHPAAAPARHRPQPPAARAGPRPRRPRPRRPLNRQATRGPGDSRPPRVQGGAKRIAHRRDRGSALDAGRTAPGQSGAGSGGQPPPRAANPQASHGGSPPAVSPKSGNPARQNGH